MRKDFAPMLLDFAGVCELGYLNNIFFHLSKELNDEYYFKKLSSKSVANYILENIK